MLKETIYTACALGSIAIAAQSFVTYKKFQSLDEEIFDAVE